MIASNKLQIFGGVALAADGWFLAQQHGA